MDFSVFQQLPYLAEAMAGQEFNILSPLHLMDGVAEPVQPLHPLDAMARGY